MGKGSFQKEDEGFGGFAGDALCRFKMTERMGFRSREGISLG